MRFGDSMNTEPFDASRRGRSLGFLKDAHDRDESDVDAAGRLAAHLTGVSSGGVGR